MAVTITLTADASTAEATVRQLQASITQSMAGIDAKMQDTARKTGQATDAWRQGLTGLSQTVQRTTVEQGNLSKAFLQTGQAAQTQVNAFQRLQKQYADTTHSTTGLTSSLKNLAAGFSLVLGAQAVISAVKNFGQAMVQAALDMDTARLSLAAVTGSTTAAAAEMEALRVISATTGVGLDVLTKQWAGLFAAVNQVPGRLEVTREIFSSLIETSARMGKSTEQIGLALYGLTQIAGGTTLQMQDMNQVTDALPGILPALTRELGLTQTEFRKLIGEGKILVDDVFPKLSGAIKSLAKGDGSVATLQSEFGRASSAWTEFLDAVGQLGPIAALRVALQGVIVTLQGVTAAARDAKAAIFGLSDAQITANALQNIQQKITETSKSIQNMEQASTTGVGGLINQLMGLDQQTALTTKRKELEDLTAAQTALLQSQKALGPTAGQPGLTAEEKARAKQIEDLKGLKNTAAETKAAIGQLNLELDALRSKDVGKLLAIGLDPLQQGFERERSARETKVLADRQKLQDELLGIDRKANARGAQEAGQSAVERAKAVEEALATQLTREEAMIEASADTRRKALFEATQVDLRTQGPGAVEAIAARQVQELRRIATETAAALETLRLGELDKQTKAREVTLRAEIAAAGKNLSAATAAQEELTHLTAEHETQRAIITGKRAETEQKTGEQVAKAQIAHAREVNKIVQEMEDDRIKSRIDLVDEQIALIEAQMEGEILTTRDGLAQIQELEQQRFDDQRLQVERAAQIQVDAINRVVQATLEGSVERAQAEELWVSEVERIHQGKLTALQAIDLQQQSQQQQHLNDLTQGWREWARDVQSGLGDFLVDWAEGQVDGMTDILDRLKSYFFRTIADMIAYAATHQIILPIVTQVLGGLGAALPGVGQALGISGLGGMAGTAMQGVGVVNTLMGPQSPFGTALTFFGDSVAGMADRVASLFGRGVASPSLVASLPQGAASLPPGVSAFNPLQSIGGLVAGITGLTKALTARDTAGKVIGGVGGALGFAGMIPGPQQPFLLAASAIVQLLGPMVAKMFSPAGPRFALGGLGGVGVRTGPGGLEVTGDVTSQIGRQERLPSGADTAAIQESLNTTVMRMIEGMVTAINTSAIDPVDLLGPTQQALNDALANALKINSSSAKNFQKDMEEQVKFVGVQVGSFFLKPLNDAFQQLASAELDQQLSRLPQTTQGMLTVFRGMNEQLDNLAKVANTDVLRQLSSVQQRVEAFGHALADTAQDISTSIVNQISDQLIAQANVLLDAPLATQITRFGAVMNQSFAALESLRVTQRSLQEGGVNAGGVAAQFERLSTLMVETAGMVATDIVSGALSELATDLNTVLIQPIRIQATTVNSLFNDSLAALNTLWAQWHALEGAGLDASGVQRQFDRLLGGMLDSVQAITEQAFSTEGLTDFLDVLLSIPAALTNLNPVRAMVRQLGQVFAQVAGPIQQVIDATQLSLQTTGQRAADTAARMRELQAAIAQTGGAIEQVLPLYAQLAQATQANAMAQIDAANEAADAELKAINTAADAHVKAINTWGEEATDAIQARSAEFTAGWNAWADDMTEGLHRWVRTTTQMVNDLADAAKTTASQLSTVNAAVLAELSPAQQRTTLERQKAQLEAVVNATGSPAALTELISVNQQLLSVAKQGDDLSLQMRSINELQAIQMHLRDQLVAMTGQSDPVFAQITIAERQETALKHIEAIQEADSEFIQTTQARQVQEIADRQARELDEVEASRTAQLTAVEASRTAQINMVEANRAQLLRSLNYDLVYALSLIQYQLQQIFAVQYQATTGVALPQPLFTPPRPPGAQQGGLLTLASRNRAMTGPFALAAGGMVPAMLEPGERGFPPPMRQGQQGALMAMNREFSRFAGGGFTVPGHGSGDTVPALVPSGTFILNRRASRALGYQGGGQVMHSGTPALPSIVIDLRGAVFSSPDDARKVKHILERDVISIVESYYRKTRVDSRLH